MKDIAAVVDDGWCTSVHVFPPFGPKHDINDEHDCWCEPEVELTSGPDENPEYTVRHRSMN